MDVTTEADRVCDTLGSFVQAGIAAQKSVDEVIDCEAMRELCRITEVPRERFSWLKNEEEVKKLLAATIRRKAAEERKRKSPKAKLQGMMIELLCLKERLRVEVNPGVRGYNESRIAELHGGIEHELVRLLGLKKTFKNWAELVRPLPATRR